VIICHAHKAYSGTLNQNFNYEVLHTLWGTQTQFTKGTVTLKIVKEMFYVLSVIIT